MDQYPFLFFTHCNDVGREKQQWSNLVTPRNEKSSFSTSRKKEKMKIPFCYAIKWQNDALTVGNMQKNKWTHQPALHYCYYWLRVERKRYTYCHDGCVPWATFFFVFFLIFTQNLLRQWPSFLIYLLRSEWWTLAIPSQRQKIECHFYSWESLFNNKRRQRWQWWQYCQLSVYCFGPFSLSLFWLPFSLSAVYNTTRRGGGGGDDLQKKKKQTDKVRTCCWENKVAGQTTYSKAARLSSLHEHAHTRECSQSINKRSLSERAYRTSDLLLRAIARGIRNMAWADERHGAAGIIPLFCIRSLSKQPLSLSLAPPIEKRRGIAQHHRSTSQLPLFLSLSLRSPFFSFIRTAHDRPNSSVRRCCWLRLVACGR